MKAIQLVVLLLVLFCFPTFSQIKWELTNGPEGGALSAICNNDSFAFWGDRYKLYRTADGIKWEQLPYGDLWPIELNNIKIAALQNFNYSKNQSGNFKFIVSYDNGLNWKEGKLPPTSNGGGFSNMAVCTHGIYVPGGIENFMYRTTDDGLTWSTIPAPGNYCYDLFAFEDQLYALWNNKYWRLNLIGLNWELISPDFGKGNYPNGIYISGQNRIFSTENSIVASIDDGLNWKTSSFGRHNNDDPFIPIGKRIYKLGNFSGLLYTEDSGLNWQIVNIETTYSIIDLASVGGKLLGSSYNKGVLSFDENKSNFISANKGLYSAVVYNLALGTDFLWAACGNGVFGFNLKTFNWLDNQNLPIPKWQYSRIAISSSAYVAGSEQYDSKLYLSKNQGLSWDTLFPFKNTMFGNAISQIYWLNDVLIIKGIDYPDVRSEDLGKTWISDQYPEDIVAFKNKFIGLDKTQNVLKASMDFGKSWKNLNAPGFTLFNLFATEDRLFLIGIENQHSSLYYSDDGENWIYSNDGLPNIDLVNFGLETQRGAAWKRDEKYFLYEPSIGLFVTKDSCKTWLFVEKGDYSSFVMSDTNCFAGSILGGGVIKSGLPQNFKSVTKGQVYKDDNNNGIQDTNEIQLAKIKVELFVPGTSDPFWSTITNNSGRYTIGNNSGNGDTIRLELDSKYSYQINPAYHLSRLDNTDLNFGVNFNENVSDVSVSATHAGHPRPGFDINTFISYRNEGNLPQEGTVSLKLDTNYHFISSNPTPNTIIGNDSLVWNFSQLLLFENRQIELLGQVDPAAQIGNLLSMRGQIKTTLIDENIINNRFELVDSVFGSYDPNDKHVEPFKGLTEEDILMGKELIYTIRFQNTGTIQADKIRITDYLDTALNLKSLRYISSSHPVSGFNLLPGGILEVSFDPISLPAKITNEASSQGFVNFAIQWNKSFNAQYKIFNSANIYFDYNAPIKTNSTQSEVLVNTNTENEWKNNNSASDLILIPNPAKNIVHIITKHNFSGPIDIILFNLEGKECFRKRIINSSQLLDIDTRNIENGVYLLSLKSNKTFFGKLIIDH